MIRAARFSPWFPGGKEKEQNKNVPLIEAVDIVLPFSLQPAWVERALVENIHVISEKPVAPFSGFLDLTEKDVGVEERGGGGDGSAVAEARVVWAWPRMRAALGLDSSSSIGEQAGSADRTARALLADEKRAAFFPTCVDVDPVPDDSGAGAPVRTRTTVWSVAENWRLEPSWVWLSRFLKDELMDRLSFVDIRALTPVRGADDPLLQGWRGDVIQRTKSVRSLFVDVGVHYAAAMRKVLGPVESEREWRSRVLAEGLFPPGEEGMDTLYADIVVPPRRGGRWSTRSRDKVNEGQSTREAVPGILLWSFGFHGDEYSVWPSESPDRSGSHPAGDPQKKPAPRGKSNLIFRLFFRNGATEASTQEREDKKARTIRIDRYSLELSSGWDDEFRKNVLRSLTRFAGIDEQDDVSQHPDSPTWTRSGTDANGTWLLDIPPADPGNSRGPQLSVTATLQKFAQDVLRAQRGADLDLDRHDADRSLSGGEGATVLAGMAGNNRLLAASAVEALADLHLVERLWERSREIEIEQSKIELRSEL